MKRKSFLKRLLGIFAVAVPLKATQAPLTKWCMFCLTTHHAPDLSWEWARPFGWTEENMEAWVPLTCDEVKKLDLMRASWMVNAAFIVTCGEWLDSSMPKALRIEVGNNPKNYTWAWSLEDIGHGPKTKNS